MKNLFFLASLLLLFSCNQPMEQGSKANFIIIYADDLGYGDVGQFASREIKTPNVDKLIKEGQVWTNFYSSAPVCSPSRGALMTGKLPINTGLYGDALAVLFPNSEEGIPQSETTLAEILLDNGYETGIFGKWHLGDRPDFFPTRHGFISWFGIPYSNDMDWEIDGITADDIFSNSENIANSYSQVSATIRKNIFNPDIKDWNVPLISSVQHNKGYVDKVIERPANQETITRRYTLKAKEFIEKSHSNNKPFFVFLSHSMPHVPLFRSKEFVNKSGKGIYADVLQEIDWSIGVIIKVINSLDIKDKTYLIFTSDNGPWLIMDSHAGSSGPLRDGKGTTFEGGMRVMTFFWGSNIKPSISEGLGMQTDILATVLSLAGIKTEEEYLDSFDLSGALFGKNKSPRDFIPFYSGSELRAFRYKNMKAHFITQGAYGMSPKRQVHKEPIFFDLKEDIYESKPINIKNDKYQTEFNDLLLKVDEHKDSVVKKGSIFDKRLSN